MATQHTCSSAAPALQAACDSRLLTSARLCHRRRSAKCAEIRNSDFSNHVRVQADSPSVQNRTGLADHATIEGCSFDVRGCVWIARRFTKSSDVPPAHRKRSPFSHVGFLLPSAAASRDQRRRRRRNRRTCPAAAKCLALAWPVWGCSASRTGSPKDASGLRRRANATSVN